LVLHTSSTAAFRGGPVAASYSFSAPAAAAVSAFNTQRGTSTYASGLPATAPACTPTVMTMPAIRLRLA
jgi:hypothetical protein